METKKLLVAVTVAVVLFTVGRREGVQAQQTYSVRELSAPEGSVFVVAHSINDSGQVAGEKLDGGGVRSAVVWQSDGRITVPGVDYVSAQAINSSGQTAGACLDRAYIEHACIWGESRQDIGVLPNGGASKAFAINDLGLVAGASDIYLRGQDLIHAFIYDYDKRVLDLGTLPGGFNSWANGINNLGEVVGSSGSGRLNIVTAFVWRDGTMTALAPLSPGLESNAYARDDLGNTVGSARRLREEPQRAVLWPQTGGILALESLPNKPYSVALAIKNGVIVGLADVTESTTVDPHAVMWDLKGAITDLNDLISPNLGWTLLDAVGVNSNGEIVGNGLKQGQRRVYVLSPINSISNGHLPVSLFVQAIKAISNSRIFSLVFSSINFPSLSNFSLADDTNTSGWFSKCRLRDTHTCRR